MIAFRLAGHSVIRGRTVVEIWDDDRFVGQFTETDSGHGIRLMSKHVESLTHNGDAVDSTILHVALEFSHPQ